MYPKWALPRHGSSRILVLLACLLASLATAEIAHVCIDLLGAVGAGGDAYDDHAHASVAPVGLSAVALIGTLLLRSAAHRIGRSQAIDPALLLARRFGTMHPLVPTLAVSIGGFATLIAMEFTEQVSSLGRIEGIADALGGNALVGLAIIACVAALLTFFGLRCAGAILQATVATIGSLYAWIVEKAHALIDGPSILRRAQDRRRQRAGSAFFARTRGLRAPPAIVG